MVNCPGFEPSPIQSLACDGDNTQCAKCKHRNDPYCKPIGLSRFDDRTPIEDRYPADCTDTHSPDYEG